MQAIFFNDIQESYTPTMLQEIYLDKIYEPILGHLKGSSVLDLGANIGLFTLYASKLAKKVYAVEPAEEHFECLEKMLSFNKLMDKVVPIKKAVSSKNGKARLFHNPNITSHSLMAKMGRDSEEVEIITLDKLFKDYKIEHIGMMKIDIEGEEMKLLASDGFDRIKNKVDAIAGEFHAWTDITPSQFRACLTDKGFKFQWLDTTQATTFIAERIK